ncbi:sensor histidine kinase [Kibdelosporangium phytohabitans]|uniref:sensor histidine kinase n=1 Tax=Kibdelosporangium phytohabitans TaxID=860235 RepID=UPI0009F87F3F|nr:sensor histidine kinase [Kibdelosporangium phytohabitans]MBE1465852.1 signal transduction histidine kinase [Kibdelosporangium phytohabitans]
MTDDAGMRYFWLWDVFFTFVYVVVVSLVLFVAEQATAVEKAGSIALLSVIGICYATFAKRFIITERFGWQLNLFAAVLFLSVAGSAFLVPYTQYAFFGVIPLLFMSLRLVFAIALVAVSIAFTTLFATIGDPNANWANSALAIAISVIFSVMIGIWIDKVVQQSTERGELIAKLEASQAEVGRLSHEAGVAGERERLAGEIHDTLAQGFTSIITLVQAAESELGRDEAQVRRHMALALRTARENLAESRALVAALAPAELTESSVVDAIRRQAAKLAEETGVAAEVVVQGDRRPLPTGIDVVLLRTVQESLSNVRKHAHAGSVEIVLSYQDESIVVIVSDDGTGFDSAAPTSGFGLRGMRSRIEQVGGSLSVTSSPGSGTTVELEVCT